MKSLHNRNSVLLPVALSLFILALLIVLSPAASAATVSPLYMVRGGANAVDVFDTNTNTTVVSLNTMSAPKCVVPSPTGGRVYVLENSYPYYIEVFSTSDWSLVSRVSLSGQPTDADISADGSKLYFTQNAQTGKIGVMDTNSYALSYIALNLSADWWYGKALSVTRDDTKILVAVQDTATHTYVVAINTSTQAVVWAKTGAWNSIGDLVIDTSSNWFYVANLGNESIMEGSVATGVIEHKFVVPGGVTIAGGIAMQPSSSTIGVLFVPLDNNSIFVLDWQLGVVGNVSSTGAAGVIDARPNKYVYFYCYAVGTGLYAMPSYNTGAGSATKLATYTLNDYIIMITSGPNVDFTTEPIGVTAVFQLQSMYFKKWIGTSVVAYDSAGRVVDSELSDTQGKVSFILMSGHQYTITATNIDPAFSQSISFTPDYAYYSAPYTVPFNIEISFDDAMRYANMTANSTAYMYARVWATGSDPGPFNITVTWSYDPHLTADNKGPYEPTGVAILREYTLVDNVTTITPLVGNWVGIGPNGYSGGVLNFSSQTIASLQSPYNKDYEVVVVMTDSYGAYSYAYFDYHWPGPMVGIPFMPAGLYKWLVLGILFLVALGAANTRSVPLGLFGLAIAGMGMQGLGWMFDWPASVGLQLQFTLILAAVSYMYMKSKGTML